MSSNSRQPLVDAQTLIIKIGSRVLTAPDRILDIEQLGSFSRQIATLVQSGKQVVLVSSGSVAAGMGKLGLKDRPTSLARLQAIAAVGQAQLIQFYESFLSSYDLHAAQILLVAEDLDDRRRYLNVRNTLFELLRLGVVPIINENDTVAVDELAMTFGDNDGLAASVAGVVGRGAMVILSDVDGVYDRDPAMPNAQVVKEIHQVDDKVLSLATGDKSSVGKGGMGSKLQAARRATRGGIPAVIASGRVKDVLVRIARDGEALGTYFPAGDQSLASRKRWIETAKNSGAIWVDAGAVVALLSERCSLLAIGVTGVAGRFSQGDVVSVLGPDGSEVASGLCNFSSAETRKICGMKSADIAATLNRSTHSAVIHCDNMTINMAGSP